MRKHELILALIIITGLVIRLYPVMAFPEPISYDSYFHIRVAELIKDTGSLPSTIPWPETRPYLYPPLYHILLVFSSIITGISVFNVTRFFLPLIGSLYPLATYFLSRKYFNKKIALMSAFFIAINPIDTYNSPQIISLFIFYFFADRILQKKYLHAGLLLALMYLFSPLVSMLASASIIIYLLWVHVSKESILKTFSPAAITASLWYLIKSDSLWCVNNSIGPHFLAKSLAFSVIPQALTITLIGIIVISFKPKLNNNFLKFFFSFTFVSYLGLASFIVTPAFHPWRYLLYIIVGAGALVPPLIYQLRSRQDKKLLFGVITLVSLVSLFAVISVGGYRPALGESDYKMIYWYDTNYDDTTLLAHHDTCSNILTLTDKSCLLDAYFECVPDKDAWYEKENFFWLNNSKDAQNILIKNNAETVMISSFDQRSSIFEDVSADKLYISWNMRWDPYPSSQFYKIRDLIS